MANLPEARSCDEGSSKRDHHLAHCHFTVHHHQTSVPEHKSVRRKKDEIIEPVKSPKQDPLFYFITSGRAQMSRISTKVIWNKKVVRI